MKPEKFLKSYKCDCFQPHNYCNCPDRTTSSDVFIENVKAVAESLVEVMKLCGIKILKVKETSDVIIYYLLHFEEIIHRIDSIPRKRLNKENLMHDLGRKCCMNRVEAQMTFSIIKRAFKAFYHGSGLGGVPQVLLKDKLTHTSECLWAHAAQRTAQVYAAYEGIFHDAQKDLECKIKLVYKQLHDRISSRVKLDDSQECMCINCIKRIAKETLKSVASNTDLHVVDHPYEDVYLKEQEKDAERRADEKGSQAVSKEKPRCSCPSLRMTNRDFIYRENAQIGSSQGSFECSWIPISKEEFEADQDVDNKQSQEEFPSSPFRSVEECVTECECRCEDCTCKPNCEFTCEDAMETVHELTGEDICRSTILSKNDNSIYDNNENLNSMSLSMKRHQ